MAGTDDLGVDVLDARTGRRVRRLHTPPSPEQPWNEPIAVSPDGRMLAVGHPTPAPSGDVVSVFSTRTWRRIARVASIPGFALPSGRRLLSLSPDGRRLAIADDAGHTTVWDTCPRCRDPRRLLALAAPHARDRLTRLERTVVEGS